MRALAPLLLLACTSSGVCRPDNCSGCCDANHICVGGGTDFACGSGGAACQACKPGFECVAQLCRQGAGVGGGGGAGHGSGGGAGGGGGFGLGGGFALGGGNGGGGSVHKNDLDGGSCDTLEAASAHLQVVLASCPGSNDAMIWAFSRSGCDQALACSSSDFELLQEVAICDANIMACSDPTGRMQALSDINNCLSFASTVTPLCVSEIRGQ